MSAPESAQGWRRRRLTGGTAEGRFHSHSYYDIPVFHPDDCRIAVHQMNFQERWMTPQDAVTVGIVDAGADIDPEETAVFQPVGESRAWSWQQGPMAQWRPRTGELVWNDRDGEGKQANFVARVHDPRTGATRTLPRTVYALDPTGRYALSLNMARLDKVRPGYGYVGGAGAKLDLGRPEDDGVWRMDLETGKADLILSLRRASAFLISRMALRQRFRNILRHWRQTRIYWFNHVKISPDGQRFTVKLRWKPRRKPWRGWMGVSLTCGMDGKDLRLLGWGTSHVLWLDASHLYFWQQSAGRMRLVADRAPEGLVVADLVPDLIQANVHMRHFATEPQLLVLDTPYREEVELIVADRRDGSHAPIAHFAGHVPPHGPFRCDLHPVPSSDGRCILVTSLEGGGRQLHLLERDSPVN